MEENINPADELSLVSSVWMKGRFALSSGTEEVEFINGIQCAHRAFIPKEPWEPIGFSQFIRFRKKSINRSRKIGLRKLPIPIYLKFYRTGIDNAKNLLEAQQICSTPNFKSATDALVQNLEKKSGNFGNSEVHSIYFGEPGLTTTTFNRETNSYIGLHFDNFEAFFSSSRKESKNRICLNLGRQSRFLYVLPLGFESIKRKLNIQSKDYNLSTIEIISKILEQFPNYPILRIEIAPFEYYIAATEYFIHDGSTIDNNKPDINLAIRGFFT